MSKIKTSYRLSYYEDDVVIYTNSGRHPKLSDRYKTCTYKFGKYKHEFKAFYSKEQAKIALRKATNFPPYIKAIPDGYVIWLCPKCQLYHITTKDNSLKYLNNEEVR